MIATTGGRPDGITIKSSQELDLMRRAGQVVGLTKARLMEAVAPGISTRELDRIAENEITRLGAIPSFKGYMGSSIDPLPGDDLCITECGDSARNPRRKGTE